MPEAYQKEVPKEQASGSFFIKRAAAFCSVCSLCMRWSGSPNNRQLFMSSLEVMKESTGVSVDFFVKIRSNPANIS